MAALRPLYQEVILDHGKRPRNRGPMEDADLQAEGVNPVCGDRVTVYVKVEGGLIEDIRFEGSGCLISIASASLMTEAVRGKSDLACRTMADAITGLASGAALPDGLEALAAVTDFPVRIKCATLAWRTLRAALDRQGGTVTTE